jgi:poly(3-hydroxybutyrate) depolymerase
MSRALDFCQMPAPPASCGHGARYRETRRTALRSWLCTSVLVMRMLAASATAAELPALGARLDQTTVSGLSSGAYMAGQMQLAHASIITGAGIIAGGPYGCAESLFADSMPGPGTVFLNASKAINGCMLDGLKLWGIPNPKQLATRARQLAEAGRIDPTAEVLRDKVYLFSGREDRTVVPAIVAAAADFYAALGLPREAIKYVTEVAAGHGFVTTDKGLACGRSGQPYVVDCDYDQAGDLLGHLLGPLQPRSATPSAAPQEFDQGPFKDGLVDHSLSVSGAVYVPADCRRETGCSIHVVFHGCGQNRANVGETVLADLGFIAWADTNRLILLFPQVAQSALNPQGCWDWWGYTGRDYLTRQGAQIVAVHRMLLRLAAR